MFNVVDTYFGGQISTEALAALSLSFPVFFIIIAIGTGISTGTTALIAHELGAGKKKMAKHLAVQSITFGIILSFIMVALGISLSPLLFKLLGASGEYLSMSLAYMNVIFYGTLFFMLVYIFNAILNAEGDTKSFRNFLIAGFFMNILLDPWFMYGWFGFPALGIAGLAWATVVIQASGMFYLGFKMYKTHFIKHIDLKDLFPEKRAFLELIKQGIPSSLNMMTVGIGIFVITYFISGYGSAGVAAYGIATRVEQIFLLPTIGITIATLTLVSQNNGARKFQRVKESLSIGLRYGLSIMTLGTIIIFIFAQMLMSIFTKDPEVIIIGAQYLRIASFLTWAYVILFTNISALQGLKKPLFALWIGLGRQIIAPLIIFTFLAHILGWGLLGIWWGIFIINWIAALITIYYTKKTFAHLGER